MALLRQRTKNSGSSKRKKSKCPTATEEPWEPDYQAPYGDGEVDCEGEFEVNRDTLNDGICLK